MNSETVQTVYEAAGGLDGLLRLAHAWHTRVLEDEVVSHAFSHGYHPEHTERLAAYWAEALGGPTTYSDRYGDETAVVRMHSGNGPHEEMDQRAIACFDQALQDAGLHSDERLRRVLHDYFAWATTTTMSRYHDSAEDVPDSLHLPKWSWNGLVSGAETSNSPRTAMGPRTRLIHSRASVPAGFTSLVTPIFRGSTTVFKHAVEVKDTWDHHETPYTYGAYGTPTTLELAARIAEMEKGHRTFITPGGQTALILVYFACLSAGDHVLIPESVYGPSRSFANDVLKRLNIDVEYYPPLEGGRIASRIKTNTRLIWCESPGSITMEVQDVPAIAEAAHERGVTVALDNTWAAGVYFDAFSHGVDVSVQALTKYIGGHSDLLLGSVTVRDDGLYQRIGVTHQHFGLVVSPDDCSLALRGLQTLLVRLNAIEQTALTVAAWLAERPEVEIVLHPAFPSCPGHEMWRRDFTGSSGLFSVVFRPSYKQTDLHAFMDRLSLFRMGYSWGGVTSLVVTPNLNEAPNARMYGDRLVRFYTGLEDPDDLIKDLDQALECIVQRARTSSDLV